MEEKTHKQIMLEYRELLYKNEQLKNEKNKNIVCYSENCCHYLGFNKCALKMVAIGTDGVCGGFCPQDVVKKYNPGWNMGDQSK